ncbi:hypothetical protein NL50_00055 [Clostridium acetobutylicum]|nr:hypothetical protein NL50_00055 [Clostridium acetobutylicum]
MYSIADDIKILKQMKLLGENDDIDVFDGAVYRISLNGDNSVIKDLCQVLDDSTSTPSAMDNVIQCIFTIANRCGLEDGIYEILCNVDKIIINAKRCFIQINKMILNYEPFNDAYISAIKRLGDEELSSLIDILYQLKDKYSDKYEKKIDLMMNQL